MWAYFDETTFCSNRRKTSCQVWFFINELYSFFIAPRHKSNSSQDRASLYDTELDEQAAVMSTFWLLKWLCLYRMWLELRSWAMSPESGWEKWLFAGFRLCLSFAPSSSYCCPCWSTRVPSAELLGQVGCKPFSMVSWSTISSSQTSLVWSMSARSILSSSSKRTSRGKTTLFSFMSHNLYLCDPFSNPIITASCARPPSFPSRASGPTIYQHLLPNTRLFNVRLTTVPQFELRRSEAKRSSGYPVSNIYRHWNSFRSEVSSHVFVMYPKLHKIMDGAIHAFGSTILMWIARYSQHFLHTVFSNMLLEIVWSVLVAIVTLYHFALVAGMSLCHHMVPLK